MNIDHPIHTAEGRHPRYTTFMSLTCPSNLQEEVGSDLCRASAMFTSRSPEVFASPHRSGQHPRLIIVQITCMRMLQTVLRHQRRSHNAIRNEIFPKIQDPLRHLARPLLSVGVLVAGPHELRLQLVSHCMPKRYTAVPVRGEDSPKPLPSATSSQISRRHRPAQTIAAPQRQARAPPARPSG